MTPAFHRLWTACKNCIIRPYDLRFMFIGNDETITWLVSVVGNAPKFEEIIAWLRQAKPHDQREFMKRELFFPIVHHMLGNHLLWDVSPQDMRKIMRDDQFILCRRALPKESFATIVQRLLVNMALYESNVQPDDA